MAVATSDRLRENLLRLRERVADACRQAGRSAGSVDWVAVTKYVGAPVVTRLYELGLRDFGESRPQSLWGKHPELPTDARWHLIGHWQTNKVRRTLPLIASCHAVDRVGLAETVAGEADRIGRTLPIFVEVKLSGDAAKHGFRPEELPAAFERILGLQPLQPVGLMGIAPFDQRGGDARPAFARLRRLRDELRERFGPEAAPERLSMGMSGDLEAAIAEGATDLRIGSALYEGIDRQSD